MQLGLVTYMWGAKWDLPTVIKNCEESGFAGVELRSTHAHGVEPSLSASERREVAARFEDSAVELVGLGSACEYHAVDPQQLEKNIEETKAFIKLCHDVGGSGVKVRPNGIPKERPVEATLHQIGTALKRLSSVSPAVSVPPAAQAAGGTPPRATPSPTLKSWRSWHRRRA